jgi:hypothetical protein
MKINKCNRALISLTISKVINLSYGNLKVTSVCAVQTSCLTWEAVTTQTVLEKQDNRIFKVTSWCEISAGIESEDEGKA